MASRKKRGCGAESSLGLGDGARDVGVAALRVFGLVANFDVEIALLRRADSVLAYYSPGRDGAAPSMGQG
jgi:hypothetical protein